MEYNKSQPGLLAISQVQARRDFLRKGLTMGTLTGIAGLGIVTGCSDGKEEDVSPAEDLMREHGILNRIMLVYDTCKLKIRNNEPFAPELLKEAAGIIKTFIEEYHEQLEEKFIFPLFTNSNQLVDLVQTLYIQHSAGKKITARIIMQSNREIVKDPVGSQKLISLIENFNNMYRPHEAREDTILFPALRKLVSRNEYFSMGEDFEKKEHELFGSDGFESMVDKVGNIEKKLGIYDLALFTPAV